MAFNITNYQNISTTADFLSLANTNSNGYFFTGMVFMIWLIMMISLAGVFGWEAGILSASFTALVVAIFLTYAGLTPIWLIGAFVGIIISIIAFIIYSNRYD